METSRPTKDVPGIGISARISPLAFSSMARLSITLRRRLTYTPSARRIAKRVTEGPCVMSCRNAVIEKFLSVCISLSALARSSSMVSARSGVGGSVKRRKGGGV